MGGLLIEEHKPQKRTLSGPRVSEDIDKFTPVHLEVEVGKNDPPISLKPHVLEFDHVGFPLAFLGVKSL
jgi:hypothetical protein